MPGKQSNSRKNVGFIRFSMEYCHFERMQKDTNPIVIWQKIRNLVQLERIIFRAVRFCYGLLFFSSEADTFLMNYIIFEEHEKHTFHLIARAKILL